jgi:hypothetical protein
MAEHPMLRGKLGTRATAMLFSILLPAWLPGSVAFAEGIAENAPAPAAAAPAPENKAEESAKQPQSQPAKDASTDVKPAGAKPAEAAPGAGAAAKAEPGTPASPPAKDAGSTAKAGDAKPGETAAPKPGDAKEAGAAKPRDLSPKRDNADLYTVKASTVRAVYHIHWLGTQIGDFKINSAITSRRYALQASADVSVFFGTVAWHGLTTSSGMMTANGPVPQNYTFRYHTDERREAIEIRFQQKMVQDIIINPPAYPGARSVPITAAHLQNVVDPLSAVVLLAQARLTRRAGEGACNKRLPIFDGKVRYDLVLSPSSKGVRQIEGAGKLRGPAYVCRVNYVPIAGHKPGKNDYATGNTGIEIWLVPVPEAGLLIPYYVHVPTPAGTASLVAAHFDVETPGGRHALAD